MASSLWGLVCLIGALASGTLGISPHTQQRQPDSGGPLTPRVSPQIPPRLYQRFEDVRSIEHTSDEVPSAESFQDFHLDDFSVRGFQQQQSARPGANNHLTERRRADRGGGYMIGIAFVCFAWCARCVDFLKVNLLSISLAWFGIIYCEYNTW